MKNEETSRLLSRLMAGFPGIEISEDTIALWDGCLLPLIYESASKAVSDYLLSPGKKYFPTPGEILEIYDRHEIKRRDSLRQEEREDEMAAYKRLYHEPVSKMPDDYERQAVQLIRDVTSGVCKFGDPDWNKRYKAIFPGHDPMTGGHYGAM